MTNCIKFIFYFFDTIFVQKFYAIFEHLRSIVRPVIIDIWSFCNTFISAIIDAIYLIKFGPLWTHSTLRTWLDTTILRKINMFHTFLEWIYIKYKKYWPPKLDRNILQVLLRHYLVRHNMVVRPTGDYWHCMARIESNSRCWNSWLEYCLLLCM